MSIYDALGCEPRIEVGAVLSVGHRDTAKGASSSPVDTDRFFIVSPVAQDREYTKRGGGTYKVPWRPDHPDFREFNESPGSRRTSIHGFIARLNMEDAFQAKREAATLPRYGRHASYRPTCVSEDGEKATRFYGDEAKPPEGMELDGDGFGEIVCPGERCQYANRDDPPCKHSGRLLFRPRWLDPDWEHLPQFLMRYYTGSSASVGMILGGFEDAREQAKGLGVEIVNWFGLPIVLTVSMTVSRGKGRRFPLVRMTLDGDISQWLQWQREKSAEIGAHVEQRYIEGEVENDAPEDRDLDPVTVNPPTVPSEAANGQEELFE